MDTQSEGRFIATTVVSPACLAAEQKNQDRARWLPGVRVACVGDGVSSSPYSARAAGLGTLLSPLLFRQTPERALETMAEMLFAKRIEAQYRPIKTSPETPPALCEVLREAAKAKLAQAYQTTLVAAAFSLEEGCVAVRFVVCGDSAYFAYSKDGELLTCSLPCASDTVLEGEAGCRLRFGPGDELLVKAIGLVAAFPKLARRVGINEAHAHKWIVCLPLDRCNDRLTQPDNETPEPHGMRPPGVLLVVPSYFVGGGVGRNDHQYFRLPYSKVIRRIDEPVSHARFSHKSTVTAVLPDHVSLSRWTYCEERMPPEGSVLLASDGFYESFNSPKEMGAWLTLHRHSLRDRSCRDDVMLERHSVLQAKRGDDDMSFVWVRWRTNNETG